MLRRFTTPETPSPPAKRPRLHKQPSPVSRGPAAVSALSSPLIARFQPTASGLDGGSSFILPNQLPKFNNSSSDRLSSPSTTIPETPPRSVLPPTTAPSPSSPFFKLARELRDRIYAEVLGPPTAIHVVRPRGTPEDHFLFLLCSQPINGMGICLECHYLKAEDLKTDHPVYDMSLLYVSKAVKQEVSRVVFMRNDFWFPSQWSLLDFGLIFTEQTKYMQSLSYSNFYLENDAKGDIKTFQDSGDLMHKTFPAIKALTIYLRCKLNGNADQPIFEEGIMNYFRPLSRLRLSKAHVVLHKSFADDRLTPRMIRLLQARAESIMLLDPSLPQQEMQLPPQETDSDRAKHEEKLLGKIVGNSPRLWAMLTVSKHKSKGLFKR